VASLSQGRTAAAQCGLFTHKSVPVIFEPPCITDKYCLLGCFAESRCLRFYPEDRGGRLIPNIVNLYITMRPWDFKSGSCAQFLSSLHWCLISLGAATLTLTCSPTSVR